MIPPDSYFSFEKTRSHNRSGDESPVLSPGSVEPPTFSSYTPSSLDSALPSPGSTEKPSFAVQSLNNALESPKQNILTPPQSPNVGAERQNHRLSLAFARFGRSSSPRLKISPTRQSPIEMVDNSRGSSDSLSGSAPSTAWQTQESLHFFNDNSQTNALIRPKLEHNWKRDSTSPEHGESMLARVNRRLGISEGHRSVSTNVTTPVQPQTIAIHPPGRTHNVHQPIYNIPSVEPSLKMEDSVQSKPRGRARLQSLFNRKAINESEAASTAAHLGLHLDSLGRHTNNKNNLSFLPSEAQKVATPPASAEPRLDPFTFAFIPRAISPRAIPNQRAKSPISRMAQSTNEDYIQQNPSQQPPNSPQIETGTTGHHWTDNDEIFRSKWGDTKAQAKGPNSVNVSSIPEHLPTSPLCPRNPKHRSGGKGVCPYHGGG